MLRRLLLLRLPPLRRAVVALALVAASAALPAQSASARGFMWEARRDGARVLLLGTIHVGQGGLTELSDAQRQRLREVAAIAVEADTSDAQRTLASFQRHALLPADAPGLDRTLPAALRVRLERLATRYGLTPESVWRMKPWVVANNLVVMEAMRLGYTPALSTEAQLYALAREAGLPIVEIESVDRQLALFDSAPPGLQLAYLEEAVGAIDGGTAEREIRELVAAWRAGDEPAMRKRLATMSQSRQAGERWIVEQLIDGRHPHMLATIERLASSGRLHAVAVGSLHYFGPRGLIEGLRERGYRITPLP
jgi:uncharacterized protein YbaP (TraB family)